MTRLKSLIESFHLTRRGLVAVGAGLAALVGAAGVLAVTTEDVTQHNGLSTTDPSHLHFFIAHRGAAVVDAAKAVTELGAAPLLGLLALVAAGVLWWKGRPLVVAVAPGVALAAAAVVASATKTIVGRARPPAGVRLLPETEPSFPSGHATDSAAFYLALALVVAVFVFRRPIARVAVVVCGGIATAFVGASRLVLGVHWPTDVLAGWALGTLAAILIVMFASALSRWTPSSAGPAVLRHGRVAAVLQARRHAGLMAA